jgi:lipoprotein NlpI
VGPKLLAIAAVAGFMLLTPDDAHRAPQWQSCTGNPDIDWDQQIRSCSTLIETGRESKASRAAAYTYRGNAYNAKGDHDRAIADYTEAIRLDPKDALVAYNNRGNAYLAKGELDRAIADFDEAIRLDPSNAGTYFSRGRANLYAGALPKALADFDRASALDRKDAYAALWLDIASKRSNLPGRLAAAVAQIDMTKWPAPVIRLYLGQMTPEAALAAADDPDADTKKGQICEANFYTGELDLRQGKKDEATRLFRLAVASCPKSFVEYDGAKAELKALGVAP